MEHYITTRLSKRRSQIVQVIFLSNFCILLKFNEKSLKLL